MIKDIVIVMLTVAAVIALPRQCRKPTWWPGRLFLRIMNSRHARVTNWGLKHVVIDKRFAILDVCCGGGRTIDTLATMASEGNVYTSSPPSRRTTIGPTWWQTCGRSCGS